MIPAKITHGKRASKERKMREEEGSDIISLI